MPDTQKPDVSTFGCSKETFVAIDSGDEVHIAIEHIPYLIARLTELGKETLPDFPVKLLAAVGAQEAEG